MQTFLPFPSFSKSFQCLDYKRLGKQRIECWQILQHLDGKQTAWINHPAVKMWTGHQAILCIYGIFCCKEWIKRQYKDTMFPRFKKLNNYYCINNYNLSYPSWWGNEQFHSRHRAALLFKNPSYYSSFGWTEKPEINYHWPIK